EINIRENSIFINIMAEFTISEDQRDMIKDVLETGGKRAAESISMMIGSSVEAEVANIHEDAYSLYEKEIEKENLGLIVYSDLKRGEGGITMYIMYEESAKKLSNVLLGRDKDEPIDDFGEDEMSAIKEIGNIVIGNFLGEVSDYFETSILHTPPKIVHDMVGIYFENVIGYTAMLEDAIIADVSLSAKGVGIDGKYILIPSDKLTEEFVKFLNS
ncbi:MAG: chemotaxis protein CheC, partial [Thermoplasmatota archaeon]